MLKRSDGISSLCASAEHDPETIKQSMLNIHSGVNGIDVDKQID